MLLLPLVSLIIILNFSGKVESSMRSLSFHNVINTLKEQTVKITLSNKECSNIKCLMMAIERRTKRTVRFVSCICSEKSKIKRESTLWKTQWNAPHHKARIADTDAKAGNEIKLAKKKYLLIHERGANTLYFVAASGKDVPIVQHFSKYRRIEHAVFCPIGNPLKLIVSRKRIMSHPLPGSDGNPKAFESKFGDLYHLACDTSVKMVFIVAYNKIYKGSMELNTWKVIFTCAKIHLMTHLQISGGFLYWSERNVEFKKTNTFVMCRVDYDGLKKTLVTEQKVMLGFSIYPKERIFYACVRGPRKFNLRKLPSKSSTPFFKKSFQCLDIEADQSRHRVYILTSNQVNFYSSSIKKYTHKVKIRKKNLSSATIQTVDNH